MSEFNSNSTDIEKASPANHQLPLQYENIRHIEEARDRNVFMTPPHRVFASGTPLGLLSFATTTFILGMFYVHTRGIHVVNVVVGMTIAVGGIVQFAAGMWEFANGQVFAATAFSAFGGFWSSLSLIYLPGTGILAAYDDPAELGNALGIWILAWFMFAFIFFPLTWKSILPVAALFFFLNITFLLLGFGNMYGNETVIIAGGYFAIITSSMGFWGAATLLYTPELTYFSIPGPSLMKKTS